MDLYIVTGTTRGLGEALARRIASDPKNRLYALSRAPDGPIPGGECIGVDMADGAAVERACDRLDGRLSGAAFDKAVLINNAGVVSPVGPLDEVDPEAMAASLEVNLVAPMRLMRRFLRSTGEVKLRRIINISSGAARRPIFGWGAYCTAKAGLDMASRAVALEAQSRGWKVEVSSLAPGVIDTPMQAVVRSASAAAFIDVERFRAMKADGTLRPADDVAADILRLEALGRLAGEVVADLRGLLG
jgi:benzil reductase ((S)-benzoin forming)